MSIIKDIALAKAIGGGGPSVTVEPLSVMENGTTTAPSGKAYSPVSVNVQPTLQSKTATENGTVTPDSGYDGLSQVNVNVQPTLQSKTVTENGTVTPDAGYDGLSSVVVDVSGGGGIPLLSRADWTALTTAQKRAYGLVAIQDTSTGFKRGDLVNGVDYVGSIVQSGTAASSTSFTVVNAGEYTLVVIAMNNEASSKALEIDVTQNSVTVSHDLYIWHDYYGSGNNRRNYRLATFDVSALAGNDIAIEVTQRSYYTSFVWALIDNSLSTLAQALTSSDAATSGTYANDAVVLYGTFDNNSGGTITMELYTANTVVTTQNPGSNYKSSYIFWMDGLI